MAKGNAIVMYLEQARIHGEPIGVTHSEVLFTKPNGYTVQPHNRVVSKADNKTMGESFLNELIYVLGAEDGEERGYHLFFSNNSLLGSTIRNDAMAELYSQLKILNERGTQDASGK